MPNTFLQANLGYLAQAASLIKDLDDIHYAQKLDDFHGACVGAHIRHCLDHYDSFVQGLDQGKIDYDTRHRNLATEINTRTAASRIVSLQKQLSSIDLKSAKKEILVKMDCGVDTTDPWVSSSLARELQFLVSHTVHHFAIVAAMLKGTGRTLPADFGVAPSTLAHQTAS